MGRGSLSPSNTGKYRKSFPDSLLARLMQFFELLKCLVFEGFATTSGVFRLPRNHYEAAKVARNSRLLGKTRNQGPENLHQSRLDLVSLLKLASLELARYR